MDLNAALAAVEASTKLLSSALPFTQSWELIDKRYADVRVAQAKLKGALGAYLEHLKEPASAFPVAPASN